MVRLGPLWIVSFLGFAAVATGCASRTGLVRKHSAPETIPLAKDLQPTPSLAKLRNDPIKAMPPRQEKPQQAAAPSPPVQVETSVAKAAASPAPLTAPPLAPPAPQTDAVAAADAVPEPPKLPSLPPPLSPLPTSKVAAAKLKESKETLTRSRIVSETNGEITVVSEPKPLPESLAKAVHDLPSLPIAEPSATPSPIVKASHTAQDMEWSADAFVAEVLAIDAAPKIPVPGEHKTPGDAEEARAQLVESAKIAFYDYFFVTRAIEINEEALQRLKEFRETAETRHRAGLAPQQEVLQADVEIGRHTERALRLEGKRRLAVARVNMLRNKPGDTPLPTLPRDLPIAPASHSQENRGGVERTVQEAMERVQESERILAFYEKTVLPTALENVKAAQAAYETGKLAFLALVDAQRNLVNVRERQCEAVAEYHRRLAAHERAVRGPLPTR
jgi:hypothetical protein